MNDLRSKDQTLQKLEEIFKHASMIGGMTHVKKVKTASGVKDTFQEFFLEHIYSFTRKLRGPTVKKQELLDIFVNTTIPDDITSPVWRIKGKYTPSRGSGNFKLIIFIRSRPASRHTC